MKIIHQKLCLILVTIMMVNCQNSNSEDSQRKFAEIKINSESKIFYFTKSGGLVGSVEEITFVKDTNNKLTSLTFYTDQIYFKIKDEKVKIFAPEPSYKNSEVSNFETEIEIHDLENSSEIADYKNNFKNYGLNVISIK